MTQARDLADGKFDTDTLVVDAANDRVGMGTTSPYGVSNFMNLTLKGKNASSGGLIRSETSDASITSRIYTDTNGLTLECDTDDNVLFRTNGGERGRFLSGGGLTFNGDTATANALDDYEEGTWTPVIDHNSSSNSTFGSVTGNYTKIGNTVTAQFRVDGGNTGTAGSFLEIGGLPFTVSQGQVNQSIGIWGSNPSSQVGNIHGHNPPRLYKGGTDITTQMTFVTGMLVYKV